MVRRVGVGIVGAGHISAAYLNALKKFGAIEVHGIADMRSEAAQGRASEFGIKHLSMKEVFEDPAIEIVLNLTTPKAHLDVGLQSLAAGKHVYSEKPLGITFEEGKKLLAAANARHLRVGCAPDTCLGGGHQAARRIVDSGDLGQIVGGTAFCASPGHEYWHSNPEFYYDIGGGPMLDMGPYYITDLVNLLGPVSRVMGISSTTRLERPIRSEPRRGQMMPVKVATHATGTLLFRSGAIVTITISFDVAKHAHVPIEIYGTEASLLVPDPNKFGGEVKIARPRAPEWDPVPILEPYVDGNYRSLGLVDMAQGIVEGRAHRASGELALHVLEVMEAFEVSSRTSGFVDISTSAERPQSLSNDTWTCLPV